MRQYHELMDRILASLDLAKDERERIGFRNLEGITGKTFVK